jgi:hypothetical protein
VVIVSQTQTLAIKQIYCVYPVIGGTIARWTSGAFDDQTVEGGKVGVIQ